MSLDPRSKLFACFAVTGILTMLHTWIVLTAFFGLLMAALLVLRLGRSWLRLLRGLGVASLMFFVIALIAFDLSTALVSGLRLLTIGTAFSLFFFTTPPEDLSNALVRMGLPYPFTFVLSVAMQFVEVLTRRAANIRDAQRARGIPLDKGVKALRYLPALMGPLLVQAFKLADELAEAMETRGFGAPGRRFRHNPQFRMIDWMTVAASMASLVITWIHLR